MIHPGQQYCYVYFEPTEEVDETDEGYLAWIEQIKALNPDWLELVSISPPFGYRLRILTTDVPNLKALEGTEDYNFDVFSDEEMIKDYDEQYPLGQEYPLDEIQI